MKKTDASTLSALRGDVAAIRKTIAGERTRLDGLMSLDRHWPIAEWRSLYLGHPVTGPFARALIWDFRGADGANVAGMPCDATTAVTMAGDRATIPQDAEVRLWHPVHAAPQEVRAWRLRLLEQQVSRNRSSRLSASSTSCHPSRGETRVYSNRSPLATSSARFRRGR